MPTAAARWATGCVTPNCRREGGKCFASGSMSWHVTWRDALTVLNVSPAGGEARFHLPAPQRSRKWIFLLSGLTLVVLALNVAVFFLVQGSQRAMEARETDLQRRQVAVSA